MAVDTGWENAGGTVCTEALAQLQAYELPEHACHAALLQFDNKADEALDFLLDTPEGRKLCGAEGGAAAKPQADSGVAVTQAPTPQHTVSLGSSQRGV